MTEQNELPPGMQAQVIKAYDILMECVKLNKIDMNVGISAMWSIMMTQFEAFGLSWEQVEENIDMVKAQAKQVYMNGDSPDEIDS